MLNTPKLDPEKARKLGKFVQAAQKAMMSGGRKPFVLQHQITHHCNCTCESCLWRDNKMKELETDEIKRIYTEARDAGFIALFVWGGEPLLRKDFAEILKFARVDCDFMTNMVTNGFYLSEKIDSFGDYIDVMVVSIDSTIPEKHDKMRGVPGIFNRAVEGIEKVRSKFPKVSVQINCCIQKEMLNELEDFIKFTDKIGVPISFSSLNTGRHKSEVGLQDMVGKLAMTDDELSSTYEILLKAKERGANIFNTRMYLNHFIGGVKLYKCHFQKVFVVVKGNGDIEDCQQINVPIANLRNMSLSDALKLPRFQQLRDQAEKCHSCNSATMVDCSYIWENPAILMQEGGLSLG